MSATAARRASTEDEAEEDGDVEKRRRIDRVAPMEDRSGSFRSPCAGVEQDLRDRRIAAAMARPSSHPPAKTTKMIAKRTALATNIGLFQSGQEAQQESVAT